MKAELVPAEKRLALLADLEAAGAFTPTGLRLHNPNLTYSTYEAIGALLGQMHRALQWAIGDYILHGEHLFGEDAYQAIESLGISEETRREYVRVASRVSYSTRRKDLPWSTHRAVASLPPAEQKRLLKQAVDEGLSHHQLRQTLRNGSEPDPPTVCPRCHRPL